MKEPGKNSGRSKSRELPNGKRRTVFGGELGAPRSLRKKHLFLKNCTDEELVRAQITR